MFCTLISQVHVSEGSTVPDHCRVFALSDSRDSAFSARCRHQHKDSCDRCALLLSTLDDIDIALNAQMSSLSDGEEVSFIVKQARASILSWKAHILRSIHQDAARIDLLESLDESSVLVVQDWAMKYLPRKYRESQTDWFGKRGIPWHLSVAFRKVNDEMQLLTFCHIFRACSQDSGAVVAVMADVVRQLKSTMPSLTNVYYRQDNAGCYHSALTIVCASLLGKQEGVAVKRLDFSDPQGGKGACDRKAATIKSHMRVYLDSGNDIETPEQMYEAITSFGGVPSCSVSICESATYPDLPQYKINGVSFLTNIEYSRAGIRVWRAYGIGKGKKLPKQQPPPK